ncbi:MAG: 3-oxoacyl-ACP reductase [Microbacteriaceae bacterium]|nr:3-oxoacyl-ACP reductase [Microbacteriaceae bacterium]
MTETQKSVSQPETQPVAAQQSAQAQQSSHAQQDLLPIAMPASQPVLLKIVRCTIVISVVLAFVGGAVGFLVVGERGLWGAVIGALIGGVCMALSAGSMAFANRFIASPVYVQIFFGSVAGTLLVKMVLFLVAIFVLKDQPWLEPKAMFITIIVGVVLSLVFDMILLRRARIPLTDTQQQHS